jgi:hypothetical protein
LKASAVATSAIDAQAGDVLIEDWVHGLQEYRVTIAGGMAWVPKRGLDMDR